MTFDIVFEKKVYMKPRKSIYETAKKYLLNPEKLFVKHWTDICGILKNICETHIYLLTGVVATLGLFTPKDNAGLVKKSVTYDQHHIANFHHDKSV